MSETRWTKGPWKVEHAPDALPGRVRSEDGQSVASPHFAGLDDETIRANAHLIAQAPNLYRRLARRVTNCGCVLGDGVRCLECEADRKVLAKARGEGADDG